MPNHQTFAQAGPPGWKDARLIQIDAVPPAIGPAFGKEVLMRCLQEGTSLELCVSTAGASPAALAVMLVLRTTGAYPMEVKQRLNRVSANVLKALRGADFRARTVEASGQEGAWLELFFHGDLQKTTVGCGFFPKENTEEAAPLYIPGSYAQPGIQVDMGKLASLVSSHSNALLSVQFNTTHITQGERQLVHDNLGWLSNQPDTRAKQAASAVFARLQQAGSHPVFFINFFCLGSDHFIRDFAAQVQLQPFQAYRFSAAAVQGVNYPLHANMWLTSLAVSQGHDGSRQRDLSPHLRRFTHLAALQEAAGAFPLPSNLDGIPGLRINRTASSREPLPAELTRPGGLYLGQHTASGQAVYLNPHQLTRHGFYVGKPGSGKTTFALGLLYRLQAGETRYPFLAIEPAKREYRSLLRVIPNLRVYTPGNSAVAPMQLNIFLPPRGVSLEQYKPNLETIFQFAVSMTHPLDIIFPQVINRCYARYGWRPDSTSASRGVQVFGIHEFIREFRSYARETYGSDPESMHNIENGGTMRLMALINNPLFDTNHTLDVEELLAQPTVVELDAISNTAHKALVMGVLLIHIMLSVQQRRDSGSRLRNLILVDEAHLLLNKPDQVQTGSPDAASSVTQLLQDMTVILRAYGTGLLFGDQSPARLTDIILSNVNLKMMFRLDSQTDRSILADVALLNGDMLASMVSLPAGEGYLLCDQMSVPAGIITPNTEKELNLDKSTPDEAVRQRMRASLLPPFRQCANSLCAQVCDTGMRSSAQVVAENLMGDPRVRGALVNADSQAGIIRFLRSGFGEAAQAVMRRFSIETEDGPAFLACVKVQFIRALLLQPACLLTEEQLTAAQANRTDAEEAGETRENRPQSLPFSMKGPEH